MTDIQDKHNTPSDAAIKAVICEVGSTFSLSDVRTSQGAWAKAIRMAASLLEEYKPEVLAPPEVLIARKIRVNLNRWLGSTAYTADEIMKGRADNTQLMDAIISVLKEGRVCIKQIQ